MVTLTTLYPNGLPYQGVHPNHGSNLHAPLFVGGGDLGDDSTATYAELGSWNAGGINHMEALAVDFGPVNFTPTHMHVGILAENLNGDVVDNMYFSDAGDPTGTPLDTSNWPGDLTAGIVTAPTWIYGVDGFNATPEPSGTGWLDFANNPAALAALKSTGLRVVLFGSSLDEVRTAHLRVYEFRMILAGDPAAPGLPPLRQDLCRDDSRVGRIWPMSSQQDSLRRLGGYY